MKLSKRLLTIQDMVPSGIAADIGSDHGKLIISLVKNKIIQKGYGVENKKAPFSRMSKAIEEARLSNQIIPIFADGISQLPSDVDIVIIAGMGGYLIIDILKSHVDKLHNVKSIIVDAHNAFNEVRKEIVDLGYFIKNEKIIKEDNIFYEIIRFDKGASDSLNDLDYEFGPQLRKEKSPVFIEKYEESLKDLHKLLSNDNLPEARKEELKSQIKRLESIL